MITGGTIGCLAVIKGDFLFDSTVTFIVVGFISNCTGVVVVVGFACIIPNRLLNDLFDVRDEIVDGAFGVNNDCDTLVTGGLVDDDESDAGFIPRNDDINGGCGASKI